MRIGIVNDIKMTIEVLKRIISTCRHYTVIWTASDGVEAVQKCFKDPPDLILMDLIMPNMGGVEATCHIMKKCPCAILIVTASLTGNCSQIFEAMGHGALDVVNTPELDLFKPEYGGKELLDKIEKIGYLVGKISHPQKIEKRPIEKTKITASLPPLLLMGSSTGGPSALSTILSHFPKKMTFSTIIIQHVDANFAPGFAKWLQEQTKLPIEVATANSEPKEGMIYIAGKNDHLIMNEKKIVYYTEQPSETPYRPSVDVLFQSVAKYWPKKSIAVLLTGMGSDGALGLKALKEAGWCTIAQQEESCIVYGMPKAAIELEAATHILPLEMIGLKINEFFRKP